MLIRLEHNGAHLFEADGDRIDKELVIGRSSQCDWRVPAEEKDVSSRHAKIYRKGGTVWIEDLDSSNGTYHLGRKIDKLKLKPGVRLSIGGCIVAVEEGSTESPVDAIPEIVMLSGRSRGQAKEIRSSPFLVGSDPGCSLVLLDPLISRHHAEITLKDDKSCWLKDLGSKNGTSVNDTPLREGQERLLKDGDKLAFAHFEARFHDGTTKRSGKKVWIRLGVMAATIALVLGMYGTWQRLKPSAGRYLEQAREAAAVRDFDGARARLDKASHARGAAERSLEIQDLSRLVTLWEGADKTWASAQAALAEGDWVRASRDLGALAALRQDAWTWSPDGADERNAAMRSKDMLDTMLRAMGALRGEDVAGTSLQAELESVRRVLAANAELPEHMVRTRTELVDIQGKLELYISESADLETALDNLATWPPPFAETIRVLDETYANSRGLLKRRSELMIEPVRALSRSYDRLMEALKLARDMQFDDALKVSLELPSTSACALDSRVSMTRANIESAHEKLRIQVNQLTYLFREVRKLVPDLDIKAPHQIAAWKDRDALARMVSCDSLDYPMPRRSRKEASGDYDRYLGVEEFYEFMVAVALRQPWREMSDAPFPTVLAQTASLIDAVEAIEAFFAKEDWAVQLTPVNTTYGVTRIGGPSSPADNPAADARRSTETAWLLDGALAQRVADLKQILAARDDLLERVIRLATETEGRPALIAAGIAYRIAPDVSQVKIKDETIQQFISRNVADNRARLRELSQSYDFAPPARQIEIRDEILAKGLPGDPIVKRMWSSANATQSRP
jgi:pSer/pThr/pTyr-binding forkhead associated (FHA) protein